MDTTGSAPGRIPMPSETRRRLAALPVAALYEAAGRQGALPPGLRCITGGGSLAGPAFTVQCAGGSNLALHAALSRSRKGDVLVVATAGCPARAYLGDLIAEAASQKGIGGIVVDGHVRDVEALARLTIPIFCRGCAVEGPTKGAEEAAGVGVPILMGSVLVHPGDFVRGDCDGVVVLPQGDFAQIASAAEARIRTEEAVREQVRSGRGPLHQLLEIDISVHSANGES